MFNNITELAESKLLLLYIFDCFDLPLSNSQIIQVVLENNFMNYFTLQQYLSELVESGFLNDTKEDKRHILSITEKGRNVLNYFSSRISDKKKIVIDEYIKKHIINIKNEVEIIAQYEPYNDKFLTNLKLTDRGNMLIEIKLPADSNSEARELCRIWKENPRDIYEKVKNLFKTK